MHFGSSLAPENYHGGGGGGGGGEEMTRLFSGPKCSHALRNTIWKSFSGALRGAFRARKVFRVLRNARPESVKHNIRELKDGAYYCYCAYVLRIARYSGFLWVVPTNTGIFLRGLKLYG